MPVTHESLLNLESYARQRPALRLGAISLRKQRQIRLDPALMVQFENDETVRYQIQEVLRAERLFEDHAVLQELQAYAPLMSDGHSWTATLFLEFPDPAQRRQMLERWAGIERALYLRLGDSADRCLAITSTEPPGQPAAVHFLRFSPGPRLLDRLAAHAAPTLHLGCDHPYFSAETALPPPLVQLLKLDLNRFRSG